MNKRKRKLHKFQCLPPYKLKPVLNKYKQILIVTEFTEL